MSSTDLREAMRELVDQAPPMRGMAVDDVRRGRRSLTRRRWGTGLAALACTAMAATGLAAYDADGPDRPMVATTAGQGVLERCRALGADALDGHWGAGDEVVTSGRAGGEVSAVVRSADGTRWASCWLQDDRGNGTFTVYANDATPVPSTEFTYGQGPEEGSFTMVERFPSDVAEARLDFGRGDVRSVRAVEGFVVAVFDDLGEGAALRALRLYDADGALLAGPENAGPGDADLPREYRSLVPEPLASAGEAANL